MRRLIVSPCARPRGQRLIHWRYVVYQRLIGVAGMRSYRLWLWSHAAAFRELGRRARAERAERAERLAQRERELRKAAYIRRTAPLRALHWLGGALSGGGLPGWDEDEQEFG